MSPNYQCPICAKTLSTVDKSLKCENNHQFDFAKEGYVNLLPVQQKKSLQPGDDKKMVMARREFLQYGHYDFVRKAITTSLLNLDNSDSSVLLDLGCGEGYYTQHISNQLNNTTVYGIDISKSAVKYASKRDKFSHYSVGTNAHLPFENNSVNVIMKVFAPWIDSENNRLLTQDGTLLSVGPGPKHLYELKNTIYEEVSLHEQEPVPDGFVLFEHLNITETITLNSSKEVLSLINMTPFAWKITEEKRNSITSSLPFSITLDFNISQYKRI